MRGQGGAAHGCGWDRGRCTAPARPAPAPRPLQAPRPRAGEIIQPNPPFVATLPSASAVLLFSQAKSVAWSCAARLAALTAPRNVIKYRLCTVIALTRTRQRSAWCPPTASEPPRLPRERAAREGAAGRPACAPSSSPGVRSVPFNSLLGLSGSYFIKVASNPALRFLAV